MTDSFVYFMKQAWPHILGFCLVAGLFFALINAALYATRDQRFVDFKKDAIERGYALYCPKNAHFAWKGECKDD